MISITVWISDRERERERENEEPSSVCDTDPSAARRSAIVFFLVVVVVVQVRLWLSFVDLGWRLLFFLAPRNATRVVESRRGPKFFSHPKSEGKKYKKKTNKQIDFSGSDVATTRWNRIASN